MTPARVTRVTPHGYTVETLDKNHSTHAVINSLNQRCAPGSVVLITRASGQGYIVGRPR